MQRPSIDRYLPMDVVVGSMDAVLNDSQFLANSANRIQLLEVLTDGAASRRELQDATGVPRSTAARILDDAEARGWIRSEGSRYRITSRGEAMITAFRGFLAAAEGIHHLGPAIEWLPEPAWKLDFNTSARPRSRHRRKIIRPPTSTERWTTSGGATATVDSRKTPFLSI